MSPSLAEAEGLTPADADAEGDTEALGLCDALALALGETLALADAEDLAVLVEAVHHRRAHVVEAERDRLLGQPLPPLGQDHAVLLDDLAVHALDAELARVAHRPGMDLEVIDYGEQAGQDRRMLEPGKFRITRIVCTHGHIDHVAGAAALKEATGAPLQIHAADAEWLAQLPQQATTFGFDEVRVPEVDKPWVWEGRVLPSARPGWVSRRRRRQAAWQ